MAKKDKTPQVEDVDCINATGHTWVAYEPTEDGFKQRCRDCGVERVADYA